MAMSNTEYMFKIIETPDASIVPYRQGQYIIQDDGKVYYDSTIGTDENDRVLLSKNNNVNNYVSDGKSDEYYLQLIESPSENDTCVIYKLIEGTNDKYTTVTYNYVIEHDTENNIDTFSWKPLNDSYDANNVYITENIIATKAVGGIVLESSGTKTLESKGQTVTEFLQELLGPSVEPTVTSPSVTINSSLGNTCYEVGSEVTPTYTIVFDEGNYSFGPDTNVSVLKTTISDTNNNEQEDDSYIESGSFNSFIVGQNMNYKMSVIIEHSDGTLPNKVPSGTCDSKQILKDSITATSQTATSYVEGLYYGTSANELTEDDITATLIRTLSKTKNKYVSNKTVNFTVPISTKTIILAVPSNKSIKKILNATVNADMTDSFDDSIRRTINLASDEKYATEYKVYI